jgi:hypothetical protein
MAVQAEAAQPLPQTQVADTAVMTTVNRRET